LIYASTQSHNNKNKNQNDNDNNNDTLGSTDEASNPEINDDNSSKINELLKQLQEVSTAKEVRSPFNLSPIHHLFIGHSFYISIYRSIYLSIYLYL
jgi:hypothetical protein